MDVKVALVGLLLIYTLKSSLGDEVTPPLVSEVSEGKEGLFKHQQGFIMIWGQVLLERITRYYYFYTPNNIEKESEWETTKCADGTFVNWFEVTNPVSNYFWTRRIFQIKFKCAKPDGSGSNDLDLYQKLTTKWTLVNAEAEVTGTNNCSNGYYTSIQFTYYLDKPRIKLALVNAWGLTMKCSKGGAIEPHKHLIISTPRNKPEENEAKSGEVDCGTGKAICGFTHKIIHNRKGAFEGLYYKVICCTVFVPPPAFLGRSLTSNPETSEEMRDPYEVIAKDMKEETKGKNNVTRGDKKKKKKRRKGVGLYGKG